MENTIVIIDGNSLINRAYYAMQRPMITKEGIYTQGIYGFINMLTKIRSDYEPGYMAVAFDLKAPTFRHLEYKEYTAGRKKMPPELGAKLLDVADEDYDGGVRFASVAHVKGLEFDGVILADADELHYPVQDIDARLLYVAVTRALHRLEITYTGEKTPLL